MAVLIEVIYIPEINHSSPSKSAHLKLTECAISMPTGMMNRSPHTFQRVGLAS